MSIQPFSIVQRSIEMAKKILDKYPEPYPSKRKWAPDKVTRLLIKELEAGSTEQAATKSVTKWLLDSWQNRESV